MKQLLDDLKVCGYDPGLTLQRRRCRKTTYKEIDIILAQYSVKMKSLMMYGEWDKMQEYFNKIEKRVDFAINNNPLPFKM